MLTPDRRLLLAALSASLLPPAARALADDAVNAPDALRLGAPRDFSFVWLVVLRQKKCQSAL